MAKTNIMIINPMNPDIGYIIPTKFEKPNLANGRASMQNNPVSNSLFFPSDTLLKNPNPLAKAVVNIAIQSIIAYISYIYPLYSCISLT